MNRFNRSISAAAVACGLCGGVCLVQAGLSNNAQTVQRLDEEHWKHPHMHRAMSQLHQARQELQDAEEIFKGHRDQAIEHVDRAIKHVEEGLREQHDEAAVPADLPVAGHLEQYPHMHHALEHLREARSELESADKIFGGHRSDAMEETDHAIKQLEEGLHNAEK